MKEFEGETWEPNWLHGLGSKHHKVPKSHLKRFTDSHGQVSVYDFLIAKFYKGKPAEIFSAGDFYTFNDANGIPAGTLEDYFSKIEGPAATLFDSLVQPLQRGNWNLDLESRQVICLFFALQILRTDRTRTSINRAASAYFEALGHGGTSLEQLSEALFKSAGQPDFTYVTGPNTHIKVLSEQLAPIAHRLLRSSMYVLVWPEDELIIGDHPVILRSKSEIKRGLGFKNVSEFMLPLDARHMFVIAPGVSLKREGYFTSNIDANELNFATAAYSTSKIAFTNRHTKEYIKSLFSQSENIKP
jgi:hypothetical protein